MSEVKITVRDDGPLRVEGPVVLVDAEGNEYESKAAFSLCRCGLSDNKPYCDGSHKGKFESKPRAK